MALITWPEAHRWIFVCTGGHEAEGKGIKGQESEGRQEGQGWIYGRNKGSQVVDTRTYARHLLGQSINWICWRG